MPEFVIFAIASSMCVLCFAAGFVAALMLRIAGRTAIPGAGAMPASDPSPPGQPDGVRSRPVEAPAVSVSAEPEDGFASAQAAPAQDAPAQLPLRPAAHEDQIGAFPTPPVSAPPAKVFLFGDPQVDATVAPPFAPRHTASHPIAEAPKPHVAPLHLTPTEIDLLPRRPLHARSARGR
jgi:hypothetical protein